MINKPNFSSIYAKGVISLFKGNFWAQLIGFAGTLLIADLYGSDLLGVFSKFISISSVLAIFFTLRLESAFVLSDEKQDLKVIFSSIIYSIVVGAIVSITLALILPDTFFSKINFLKVYLVFCVAGAVLKSLENTYLSYLLRQKSFKEIAFSRVLFTLSRYTAQIGLFFLASHIGLMLGFVVALLFLLIYFYNKTGNLFFLISITQFKETLKKNLNLVSYGVLSDNLNAINLNLIPILAGVYFSDAEIGWYFLAVVLLSVPTTFINASFSKVFFLRASEIFNKDQSQLFPFVKKYTLRLFLGLFIPFLMIYFLSSPFIDFLLKDEWLKVGSYIQLLSFLFFLRAIYNPVSHLEEVLKKNHIGLIFNIFLFAGNLFAIFYGVSINSFITTIEIISIVLPVGYISMIIYFLLTTRQLRFKKSK
ncbi:lipopolysaccharide biosynthesis protein [Pseudotenacibaculum haliotis]|uniref:Lipopolysaccharide biosynthesis protein n=1 Tax=Pseudotenacibaculum haliotis TaxID=1862138 RepID=A0ABW5LNC6_9FLAO